MIRTSFGPAGETIGRAGRPSQAADGGRRSGAGDFVAGPHDVCLLVSGIPNQPGLDLGDSHSPDATEHNRRKERRSCL